MTTYIETMQALLTTCAESDQDCLTKAAEACATTLKKRGLIHLFGSGHSVIPTMDAYPRYGSFVGLHPLNDPRLMWHNVLGPGGVRELLWLEREENYIRNFLTHEPLHADDVIIIYSHSGTNAAGIEAAIYARELGLTVIAVTSSACLEKECKHSSGKRLPELADIVIDTHVPIQDADTWVEGWERPTGGTSTVVATVLTHEVITRTAQALADEGTKLPVFVSPTVAGASVASNDEVFDAHARYLHEARGRCLPATN